MSKEGWVKWMRLRRQLVRMEEHDLYHTLSHLHPFSTPTPCRIHVHAPFRQRLCASRRLSVSRLDLTQSLDLWDNENLQWFHADGKLVEGRGRGKVAYSVFMATCWLPVWIEVGPKGQSKGVHFKGLLIHEDNQQTIYFPWQRHVGQPATIHLTLDLCTRYPSQLGGLRQCGIRSLADNSTHNQYLKLNPRPSDLESNALSTWLSAPTLIFLYSWFEVMAEAEKSRNTMIKGMHEYRG